ncbi:MAG: addiction module protein [Ignavibacteria bacterium]|nr:addiction module protein [Ignavibacteria bacterium]
MIHPSYFILTLDAAEIGHIEQLWVAEALRRRDEIRSGAVQPIGSEEAAQRIRRILGK